jgi:predicted TIM-barrel fold metal-dependent hydrolase
MSNPTESSPIVDAHVHVFPANSESFPRDVSDLFPADREAPVEELLLRMEDHDIAHAVLVALTTHDKYLEVSLRDHPRRFAGIILHHPPDWTRVDVLRRRVADTAAHGIRIYSLGSHSADAPHRVDPRLINFCRSSIRDGLKLWVHIPGKEFLRLELLMETCPELTVVLNHLALPQEGVEVDESGRPMIRCSLPPPTMETVKRLASFPNVYVLFSGHFGYSRQPYPYDDLAEVVKILYESFGTTRMMWGSDFPWMVEEPGYGAMLALSQVTLPDLNPRERDELMGMTAARLFQFASATPPNDLGAAD